MKLNTLLLSMSCAALTLPLFAQNTRMETFCNVTILFSALTRMFPKPTFAP